MKRCSKCILPETFPGIVFDERGKCNYCHSYKSLQLEERRIELEQIFDKYRGKGSYADCIVTYSGGRDSTYVALKVAKEYGMTVLLVTYDWGMMTKEAQQNWKITKEELGVDHIIVQTNNKRIYKNIRMNIRAWLKKPHLGMVPLFTQGDKQAEYYIAKVASEYNIPLIITGGGNRLESTIFKSLFMGVHEKLGEGAWNVSTIGQIKLASRYMIEYIRNPYYINSSLFESIISFSHYFFKNPYRNVENINKNRNLIWLEFYRYINWNENEIQSSIKKELDWVHPKDAFITWRTDDCTAPFYNYVHLRLAGFTENDTYRSNMIREGIISRENALEIVARENIPRIVAMKDDYLDRIGISLEEITSILEPLAVKYDYEHIDTAIYKEPSIIDIVEASKSSKKWKEYPKENLC